MVMNSSPGHAVLVETDGEVAPRARATLKRWVMLAGLGQGRRNGALDDPQKEGPRTSPRRARTVRISRAADRPTPPLIPPK